MKFSDMMGKHDRGTTEVTEPQLPPEAATAPPVPEAPIRFGESRTELEDAAAAFGGGSITPPPLAPVTQVAPVAPPPMAPVAPVAPPVAPEAGTTPAPSIPPPTIPAPAAPAPAAPAQIVQPSISDVVAELAPRPAGAVGSDGQLDASAWLDDVPSIDDDLLPH